MAATIKDGAPYRDFAERLSRLRAEAGLTRAELAEKAGVSSRSIVNYESGERIPYGDTCVRLAEVFGISTDELLGMENPEVEMAKARAVDEMGRIFGSSAAKSAQTYISGAGALLAGGALSKEDQLDFINVMREVLADAEIRAREKYTPHKFRSDEWKSSLESQRQLAGDITSDAEQKLNAEES